MKITGSAAVALAFFASTVAAAPPNKAPSPTPIAYYDSVSGAYIGRHLYSFWTDRPAMLMQIGDDYLEIPIWKVPGNLAYFTLSSGSGAVVSFTLPGCAGTAYISTPSSTHSDIVEAGVRRVGVVGRPTPASGFLLYHTSVNTPHGVVQHQSTLEGESCVADVGQRGGALVDGIVDLSARYPNAFVLR